MLDLPIARRELLVLARSPAHYRGRIFTSLVILLLGVGFAFLYRNWGARAAGVAVQQLIGWIFLMSLFTGVQVAGDAIASEKREGTLGLLFLTPLRPFEILLGKLIACGIASLGTILILMPLLSLVFIAGSVSGTELLRGCLGVVNALFVSLGAGLLGSTLHSDRKKAVGYGSWIILFFWWGVPGLALLLQHYFKVEQAGWLNLIALQSVWGGAVFGFAPSATGQGWANLACTHALGWIFLALANYRLAHRWQEHPAKKRFRLGEWWRNVCLGKGPARVARRQKLLEVNPFLWLASRDRLRGLGAWCATVLLGGFLVLIMLEDNNSKGGLLSLCITLALVHKLMICISGAQQITEEKDQGTLEMILATPLAAREVIHGQGLAVFHQYRGVILLTFGVQMLGCGWLMTSETLGGDAWLMGLGLFAYSALYLLDLYTAGLLAVWGAIIVRQSKQAFGAAFARFALLPGLVFWAALAGNGLISYLWGFQMLDSAPKFIVFWLCLSLVNDLYWISRVRKLAPGQLRKAGLARYAPEEPGFWEQAGRWAGKFFQKSR